MNLDGEPSLILGADGFLGRHFVHVFRERGWPHHAIARSDGDFTEPETVNGIFAAAPKVRRIFHLITRQRIGAIQFDIQGELLAINSRIHLNVLEAWRQHQPQAKLVSMGSSCVYPELNTPILEDAFQTGALHPSVRGYGIAKQLLAVGCQVYAEQYGLEYLHCILATVYGPHDNKEPDRAHFMTALIDRAVKQIRTGAAQFTVWGDPSTVRDLLYVDDQIEAVLAADAHFSNTLVNCTSNQPVTIGEVADAILEVLNWQTKIHHPPDSFQGAAFKSIDSSRFLAATEWQPRIGLQDGIKRVLEAEYQVPPR